MTKTQLVSALCFVEGKKKEIAVGSMREVVAWLDKRGFLNWGLIREAAPETKPKRKRPKRLQLKSF